MSKTNEKTIVGTRIGIYDVLYECDDRANDGHKLYHVQCVECGWETNMQKAHINRAKQCNHVGLGGVYTSTTSDFIWNNKRLQGIFKGMKRRCYNSSCKDYRWYGDQGIKICDEWLHNPKLFEEWALSNGYADDLTIDRKDENKDYCPENCHWITLENNTRYKSTTVLIDVDGEIHTGREWADTLGVGTNVINTYIRKYGLENTIEFIRRYKANPNLKRKSHQSYYNLYMN